MPHPPWLFLKHWRNGSITNEASAPWLLIINDLKRRGGEVETGGISCLDNKGRKSREKNQLLSLWSRKILLDSTTVGGKLWFPCWLWAKPKIKFKYCFGNYESKPHQAHTGNICLPKTNLIQFPSSNMDFNFKNANLFKLAEKKGQDSSKKGFTFMNKII